MWRLLILAAILAIAFGGIRYYNGHLLSSLDENDTKERLFTIQAGEPTLAIARNLEKEGFIRSANAFTILVRSSGNGGKIQAGNFKLSPSMGAKEILETLKAGMIDKKVTFPEGFRVEEMGERLNIELGIENSEFVRLSKEGYMFPDTYFFDPQATASQVVKIMRDNFDKKYDETLQNKVKALGLTPAQGVILASIVEREGRSDEGRRMVAGILLKRYKIGMALNADATVQYILGYQKGENPPTGGWWKRHLSRDDLATESPYNTYLNAGFPPAPISNPGLSSLRAVADADPSIPYLYYYHDSQGRSHYAKTLDGHNENVAKYP